MIAKRVPTFECQEAKFAEEAALADAYLATTGSHREFKASLDVFETARAGKEKACPLKHR